MVSLAAFCEHLTFIGEAGVRLEASMNVNKTKEILDFNWLMKIM